MNGWGHVIKNDALCVKDAVVISAIYTIEREISLLTISRASVNRLVLKFDTHAKERIWSKPQSKVRCSCFGMLICWRERIRTRRCLTKVR